MKRITLSFVITVFAVLSRLKRFFLDDYFTPAVRTKQGLACGLTWCNSCSLF